MTKSGDVTGIIDTGVFGYYKSLASCKFEIMEKNYGKKLCFGNKSTIAIGHIIHHSDFGFIGDRKRDTTKKGVDYGLIGDSKFYPLSHYGGTLDDHKSKLVI